MTWGMSPPESDDLREDEDLWRLLDEPPPTPEMREAAHAALRAEYVAAETASRRPTRRLMLPTLGAVVLAVVAVGVWRAPAEAWSPTPVTPPDPAVVEAASQACAMDATASRDAVLIDQRVDVAVVLFVQPPSATGAQDFKTCTLAEVDGRWQAAVASDLPSGLTVMAGSIDEAALGAVVDRVIIDQAGQEVVVSYRDGYYLAWWPGEMALTGAPVRFIAADGSTLIEFAAAP